MGISAKSMECYAVVYFMRLIAIYNSSSYLPFDRCHPISPLTPLEAETGCTT